ncbi:glycosyltransferase [Arthrobacter castelli]|uniref:glycosyltransferase n=1 Tax=Arthrobacter castelli TaxID=271431 RepID=UPI000400443B|nr:glycosyltransferase [Arthrobacter castelli]
MTQSSPEESLQHFMVTWGIGDEFGGMTTMCLYRAEIFRRHRGITAPIVTFDPVGTYDEIRARLRRTGLLHADTPVLNLYEYHRDKDFCRLEALAAPQHLHTDLPDDVMVKDSNDSAGRLFSTILTDLEGEQTFWRKYFRTDGSLFARDETPPAADGQPKRRLISLFNGQGDVVKQYSTGSKWYRDWVDTLVAQRPSALVVDSAHASRFMAKYQSPYAVKAAVYHSNHIGSAGDPYRGNLAKSRKHIAENPHEWDGIVFLTEQQRQDFISRFGHTNNLFTVSNPRSRLAEAPDASTRPHNRGVMLCRLEPVKNISAAIDIIEAVRRTVPDIQLDIYGDGVQKARLQSLIETRGLGGNVALRGYANDAVNQLERSTFSLLTSKYEGQPLSIMESLARGCPPVSFDIRYGPQNLIQDGHNGFLVAAGDIEAAAEHVVELCLNPDRAVEMSRNAWESSKRFDDRSVADTWKSTFDMMWAQQEASISDVHFALERVDLERDAGLSLHGEVSWTDPVPSGSTMLPAVELQALPRTRGGPKRKSMDIDYRRPGALGVRAAFDQSDLDEIATKDDQQIDFFVIVTCGKVRSVVRVAFGSPLDPLRPYPTSETNVSLKTVR